MNTLLFSGSERKSAFAYNIGHNYLVLKCAGIFEAPINRSPVWSRSKQVDKLSFSKGQNIAILLKGLLKEYVHVCKQVTGLLLHLQIRHVSTKQYWTIANLPQQKQNEFPEKHRRIPTL